MTLSTARRTTETNHFVLVTLSITVIVMLWAQFDWLEFAVAALAYPFEIDFGEGIVWQQANMMVSGEGYSDLYEEPYVVFHYTPVFHLLTATLSSLTGDFIWTGRVVSLLSTLAIILIIASLAKRSIAGVYGFSRRPEILLVSFVIGLSFTNHGAVELWSVISRIDMLGLCLGLLGVWVGLRAIEKPYMLLPAAILFTLSIYTKQTLIALPSALYLTLLIAHFRRGIIGIAINAVIGFGVLGYLYIETSGGFVTHAFGYNINRFSLANAQLLLVVMLSGSFIVFFGLYFAIGPVCSFIARLNPSRIRLLSDEVKTNMATRTLFFLSTYLVVTALMLPLSLKSGANVNYYLEWLVVLTIFVYRQLILAITDETYDRKAVPLVCLLLAAQCLFSPKPPVISAGSQHFEVARLIENAEKPVISDDMVMLLRAGKEVIWESAIHAELEALGSWDSTQFIQRIHSNDFAFFVTIGYKGFRLYESRYSPAIQAALDEAYPVKKSYGWLVVHQPRSAVQ